MDKKRIIFGIVFLVVAILLGYLLYKVFWAEEKFTFKRKTVEEVPDETEFPTAGAGEGITTVVTPPGELPSAISIPSKKGLLDKALPSYPITRKVDAPIMGATLDRKGAAKFYNQTDGKFYRLSNDGSVKEMSDEVFYNVQNVTWSPTNEESIIEYPDGSNIYYDFNTQKQVTLPKHWEDFSFSKLGDKIASKSMGLSPENRWLVTADPEGKGVQLIEPMGEYAHKVNVDWSPNQQIVATSLTGDPLGADRQKVLFVGLHGENFRSTIIEGRGFESKWSPEGKRLLYNVYSSRSNFKPELWIVNAEGNSIGSGRKLLNLNTWQDKCTFNGERFIYCATPVEMQIGAGFAPGLSDHTQDQIYKIDLETGIKTQVPVTEFHVIDSMFVGDDGDTLYFTDKQISGLFSISL